MKELYSLPFNITLILGRDSVWVLAFSVVRKTTIKRKSTRKERNSPFLMDCASQLFSMGDFEESVFTNNN